MMRLIIGMSGATGPIYGIRLLEALKGEEAETHLIITSPAREIILQETSYSLKKVESLAHRVYDDGDLSAPISSGSFKTDGMIIIPCSIKSLSSIAHSYNMNLLTRAADVTLKERRKLVLVVRETPLHQGHLEMMLQVSGMGGIILPPIPAFYFHPKTLDDLINHTVGKVLDLFGINHHLFERWGSPKLKKTLKKKRFGN
jgi:4-hydroxy-3-polyprenylbenzoate decarboxylase